jgi:CheY-like chemotaxis protein
VVEDETMVALTVREALEELGCEVTGWANSPSEAERLAAAHQPDLLLMDVRLKGPVDGVSTAAQLRERYSAPVVFMTGFAEEEQLAEASRLSPIGVLKKPFRQEDLEAALAAVQNAPDA